MRNPLDAMRLCLEGLAGELKTTLGYKENLVTINGHAPLLESYSTECVMWAAAIWPVHGPNGYLCQNLRIRNTTNIQKKIKQVLMPGLALHMYGILLWMR